ncbi:hypothetical protein [Pedobacter sp. Leaf194]|uniref:hypothetical protein n=1 Tax=Pedobacter sp. Leaf194 TaxID=1736297 RepID=UPI0007025517|nr:hypothetical protein [Pedobacter sp. Leaf194]KQS41776.1 hypothetical protein ASG14_04820 [Pedobacter sp. Leaf194]
MKNLRAFLFWLVNIICLLFSISSSAQHKEAGKHSINLHEVQVRYGLDSSKPLSKRITITPDNIIKMFREAGMSPTEHQLTKEELATVVSAISRLPSFYQQVLKQHLKSISFLDNMPNTALTSSITGNETVRLYHITFRSGILHQNISEWVSEKERTCFSETDSTISISIQAGILKAFNYVLLHEGTHVVDGSLQIISADSVAGRPHMNDFTRKFTNGIWTNINTLSFPVTDSLAIKSRFRRDGRRYDNTEALEVYSELMKIPFVSLYSTASWHEDLAEIFTVYYLTKIYNQPFRIIIKKNGKVAGEFEPMKSDLVKSRLSLLHRLYIGPES